MLVSTSYIFPPDIQKASLLSLLICNERQNFCGSGFGLWIQPLGWEFPVEAGAGVLSEKLAAHDGTFGRKNEKFFES